DLAAIANACKSAQKPAENLTLYERLAAMSQAPARADHAIEQLMPELAATCSAAPLPRWPDQLAITGLMTPFDSNESPYPTEVLYDWSVPAQRTRVLFPAGSPNTAQDALMLGPRGYNVSHLRGRGPVCAPVLPGTVRPDWPVRAPCSCEAEIAGGTPLTPYGTARVLACPLASPRAAWAWYSASGRPTLFMVTSLPGDEGAGLFAALDYRDWLPGHHVARSVFAKPQHCPMPPAPPGKAAPAAAPSHSPPCHLGAPETQRWTASIAGDPIDHVLQRQAGFHALDLPQHADRESLRHRLCRVVRRNRHLRMIPERARLRQRLARKDVKRRPRQRSLLDRRQDFAIDFQPAPP